MFVDRNNAASGTARERCTPTYGIGVDVFDCCGFAFCVALKTNCVSTATEGTMRDKVRKVAHRVCRHPITQHWLYRFAAPLIKEEYR
ncbi:hypothetical protein SAMN04487926_105266 [Paraburkholderia steynii]|jgi:hypothetical protein|uniref:Uncharacterized protein n=1 Tax=Paraburkholderia steynii TaxID=1245441 RepID=A0A7Z7B6A2_9BURK|nr:hypothetical protein SAMN04487926_105266 [Paraburkholderia steynii]